ncbi:MAG: hypothetical protein JSS20_11200, partial [Proteobacteria bacterium]|nr:hypothetical protein [Pseudomonadota bacterium]
MKVSSWLVWCAMAIAAFVLPAEAQTAKSASAAYKIALHVDDNDPARMNLALNNVKNIIE